MDNYLILYPRVYNQRGVEQLHSVMGVTPEGVEVNVKLRLDPAHVGKQYAPSIAEFARTDRKAKTACISSADNSPSNREGILLFTQVVAEQKRSGTPAFIAKWAAVLAEDGDSPEPVIGTGRVKIDLTAEGYKLKDQIKRANKAGVDTAKLERALEDESMYEFPVIMYHHSDSQALSVVNIDGIKDAVSHMIRSYSAKGVVGGVLVRIQSTHLNDNSPYCKEVFPRFVMLTRQYEDPEEVAESIISSLPSVVSDHARVDLIPLTRIHCGPRGSQYYGKPTRHQFLRNCFEDDAGEPMVCHVAVRVTEFSDNNTTLLSRIYPLSKPLGYPVQLGINGIQYSLTSIGSAAVGTLNFRPVCSNVTLSEVSSIWDEDIRPGKDVAPSTMQSDAADEWTKAANVHDNEEDRTGDEGCLVVDEDVQLEEAGGDVAQCSESSEGDPGSGSDANAPTSEPQPHSPASLPPAKGVLGFLIKRDADS